ncbi:MAG: acyltransferase [Crocinitomicaceae bacterium]|nr:acyltransferase [Crocinitomicaceae bacterium]
MLKSLLLKLRRNRHLRGRPKMVWGYKRLSDGVYLKRTRISNSTFLDAPEGLQIADNVFVGHFNYIEATNGVTIEEGCQITNYVTITSHSSHNSIRYYGDSYTGPEMKGYVKGKIKIGKFTFVGPHTTIMPGTDIGKGSIVAAYSYVKGDFPDFSIIAGNPAQIVGDTRDKDNEFLNDNPELREHYDKWASS